MIILNKNILVILCKNSIQIWNIVTFICLAYWKQTTNSRALCKITDETFMTGSEDMVIRLWDYRTAKCILSLLGHTGNVSYISCYKNFIASASAESINNLKIWDLSNNTCVTTLEGHKDVMAICLLDSNFLISGCYNKVLKIWDLISKKCIASHQYIHISNINDICKLNEKEFVSVGQDGRINIWDVTGKKGNIDHKSGMSKVIRLNDSTIATSHFDKTVRIWDIISHKEIFSLNEVDASHLSKSDKDTIFAVVQNNIKIIQLKFDSPVDKHDGRVHCIFMLNDFFLITATGEDKGSRNDKFKVNIWNLKTKKILMSSEGHTNYIRGFCKITEEMVISISWDKTFKVWDLKNKCCIFTFQAHNDKILTITKINDTTFATGSEDKTIKIWEIRSYKQLMLFDQHIGAVNSICLINEVLMVSASRDKTIKIFDLVSKKCIATLEGHTAEVKYLSKINENLFVSCASGSMIKIWDISINSCIKTLQQENQIHGITKFSETLLITGSFQGITIWNLLTNSCEMYPKEYGGTYTALVNDRSVASTGNGNSHDQHQDKINCIVYIWDLYTKKEILEL